jgi:hypothetical protein
MACPWKEGGHLWGKDEVMQQPIKQQVQTSRTAVHTASPSRFSRRRLLTAALATSTWVSHHFAVAKDRQSSAQVVPLRPEI